MEVLVGPTFTIDVQPSSPPPPSGDADEERAAVPPCLFLNEVGGCREKDESGFRIAGPPKFYDGDASESESSSSIGTPDDSDNDPLFNRDGGEEGEEEEEVQSKTKGRTGLGSLDPLEESLPIKRGLSSHFDGKSKSFTDLSQVNNLKELQKQENPFNKRRRILIASKWSRRSSFYSWSNPKSMPLLPVDEDEDDYEQDKARKVPSASSSSSSSLAEEKKPEDQAQLRQNRIPESYAAAEMRFRLGSFKSRSLSLADLQEHDDEEEDDD